MSRPVSGRPPKLPSSFASDHGEDGVYVLSPAALDRKLRQVPSTSDGQEDDSPYMLSQTQLERTLRLVPPDLRLQDTEASPVSKTWQELTPKAAQLDKLLVELQCPEVSADMTDLRAAAQG
jgi:hypothetical protein